MNTITHACENPAQTHFVPCSFAYARSPSSHFASVMPACTYCASADHAEESAHKTEAACRRKLAPTQVQLVEVGASQFIVLGART